MDALRIQAIAEPKRWVYDQKDSEKIAAFRAKHEGKHVDIVFEPFDSVQYWQHKYFHGYVLPDICEGMGETNQAFVKEFVLKEQIIFQECSDVRNIPSRHYKKCRTITVEKVKEDGEIVRELKGYVPSLSVLTFEEYAKFITECESIRDELIDWRHKDNKFVSEYEYHRAMAFQKGEQGEMF